MAHDEIMQELDNLQRHIMPLFIEELAQQHSDRIDDAIYFKHLGILMCRPQNETPPWIKAVRNFKLNFPGVRRVPYYWP